MIFSWIWCQKRTSIWSSRTSLSNSKQRIWHCFEKSSAWTLKHFTSDIRIKNFITSSSFNIHSRLHTTSAHAMSNFIQSIIYNEWTKSCSTKFIIFDIIYSSILDTSLLFKIFSWRLFRCRRWNEKNDTLSISSEMRSSAAISTRLSMSSHFIKENIDNIFKHIFSLNSPLSMLITSRFWSDSSKVFAKNIEWLWISCERCQSTMFSSMSIYDILSIVSWTKTSFRKMLTIRRTMNRSISISTIIFFRALSISTLFIRSRIAFARMRWRLIDRTEFFSYRKSIDLFLSCWIAIFFFSKFWSLVCTRAQSFWFQRHSKNRNKTSSWAVLFFDSFNSSTMISRASSCANSDYEFTSTFDRFHHRQSSSFKRIVAFHFDNFLSTFSISITESAFKWTKSHRFQTTWLCDHSFFIFIHRFFRACNWIFSFFKNICIESSISLKFWSRMIDFFRNTSRCWSIWSRMMSRSSSTFSTTQWSLFFSSTRNWSFNCTFNRYEALWQALWSRLTTALSTKSRRLKSSVFDWTTRFSMNFEVWITFSSFRRWISNSFSIKFARSIKTSARIWSLTTNTLLIARDARDCKFFLRSTIWTSSDAAETHIIIVNSFVLCSIAFALEWKMF